MFNSTVDKFKQKRNGILGQFQKAINGLIKVNEQIEEATSISLEKQESLQQMLAEEECVSIDLQTQKIQNEKTIEKMKDFLN